MMRVDPMKTELKAWARGEIEQNRGVEDTEKVKYLLSVGFLFWGSVLGMWRLG